MTHRRRVAEARPVRDLGTCRRGHPFTHSNGGHKYCPTCKAMSRKKLAMKRAQASHER